MALHAFLILSSMHECGKSRYEDSKMTMRKDNHLFPAAVFLSVYDFNLETIMSLMHKWKTMLELTVCSLDPP